MQAETISTMATMTPKAAPTEPAALAAQLADTPIERLTTDEALSVVHTRAQLAIETDSLSIIFGSNGESGKNATGNYSLLAKAIGMTRVHVSRVLKGKVQPSHSTLRRLSEVTGISLDDISGFILNQAK